MSKNIECKYLLDCVFRVQLSKTEFEWHIEYLEYEFAEPDCPPFPYHIVMTENMIRYVLTDCVCYYCNAPTVLITRCACGGNGDRYRIKVKCLHEPPNEFLAEFAQLQHRAKVKRASINRRERLKNAGSFTTEQIDELLKAQERSCYYCASDLLTEGKNKFHVDHYIALLNGGKNEIANIVLACPSCNKRKSFKDPIQFARSVEIELSDEKRIKVKLIRSKVKNFRRRRMS